MPVSEQQRVRYVAEIEDYLMEKFPGRLGIMTPADCGLLDWWMSRSVPLRVILRGIDDTEGKPSRPTLAYFAPAIEKAIKQWRGRIA